MSNPGERVARVGRFPAITAMPQSARALLERAGNGLFSSRPWFESFVAAGLASGAEPEFLVLTGADGDARAVLPCQRLLAVHAGEPGAASLTSFYSCDFQPVLASPDDREAAFAIGRAAAEIFAGEALIRFDSLDATRPELPAFLGGLSRGGRALLRYDHFGRWWEPLETGGFVGYMAERDGALRETIRRKSARLERAGAKLAIAPSGDVERGIADYQAVYAKSWKQSEPFPDFQPVLMRSLAKAGWLRLAICYLDGRPIAAQLWVVAGGTGTVLKLAHDQEFDRLSPGTVLTAFAIRRMIEDDRIERLDFGRGDDAYKRAWATRRTQHIGLLSASIARRPLVIARHWAGAMARKMRSARIPPPLDELSDTLVGSRSL
jgi:CelD/BcsL family acetyltransferase involved in cellulose biosynthesis